jgi:O-antigen ligase/Flp pilus assembly protein TadD
VLLLKVAVALVVFDPGAVDTFVLPKSAIGHTLSFALVGLLALCVWRGIVALRWSWLLVWVSALTAAFAIATAFALDTTVGLFGVDRRFLGLTHMMDAYVIFIGTALTFRARRDLGLLIGAAVGATLVVNVYALLQMTGHDIVVFREGTLRPIGTIGQPDTMGAYSGIAAVSILTVVGAFWRSLSPVARAAFLATAASSFVVAYADGVRAGLIAVAAGALAALLLFFVGPRGGLTRSHAGLAVLLLVGTVLVFTSPLASRITPDKLASDPSLATRVQIWQASLQMITNRPMFGVGPDNFAVAYPTARSDATVRLDGLDVSQNSTHSWPMYVLTSVGIAGAVAFLGVLTTAVLGAVRLRRRSDAAAFALIPLGAYVGQSLVTITDPSLDWVAWTSLGVIAAATARGLPLHRAIVLRRVALAVAIGCFLLLIPAAADARTRIRASELAADSERFVGLKRPLDAVAAAGEVTRLDPRRGTSWARLATVLAAAGSPSGARTAYVEASAREPWQPLWQRDIGLQWLALGDARRAIDALTAATRLDPHDAVSFDLLARLALNSGDDANAARYGDRAIELYPARVSFYDVPVIAHQRLGEWDQAERVIRRGLATQPTETDAVHLHVLLGRLYLGSGRVADARNELAWLLSHAPEDPDVAALRGQLPAP